MVAGRERHQVNVARKSDLGELCRRNLSELCNSTTGCPTKNWLELSRGGQ